MTADVGFRGRSGRRAQAPSLTVAGTLAVTLSLVLSRELRCDETAPARPAPTPIAEEAPAPSALPAEIPAEIPPEIPAEIPPEPEAPEPIEVDIEGEKTPGATTLGRREIRDMPGVLGDPYRAVEIEPGVTPVASGVPFYFIRGAPPGNIGYTFDGLTVPMLFHVGAGPSIIPPGLVDHVDLHLGPYPAEYGRVAGAVIAARSVAPRPDFHAEGVFRGIDIGGLAEVPLPGEGDGAPGSILLGGHYAVGAEVLTALVPQVALRYADYQGRIALHPKPESTLTLFGFGSYDYLATRSHGASDVLVDSDFHRAVLRYEEALPHGQTLTLQGTLGLDRSRGVSVKEAVDLRVQEQLGWVIPVSSHLRLRFGADLAIDAYAIDHDEAPACDVIGCGSGVIELASEAQLAKSFKVLFPSRTDLAMGGYAEAFVVLGAASSLTAGIRVDGYHSLGASALAIDPKLSASIGLAPWLRLLPSVGIASQPPGFAPVPGLQIGGLPGGLQRSLQASMAAHLDLGPFDFRATAFRQVTFNLTDPLGTNRGGGFEEDRFLSRSTGDSWGGEFGVRGALSRHLFVLAAYTLSRSTRELEGQWIPSAYDRAHVAQVAVLGDLGAGWKVGARSLLYSGFPAEEVSPYGALSTSPERVKPFYRLDLRASKRWALGERSYVGMVIDLQNVTLAKEVFDVKCSEEGCAPREVGPIAIPTLAFEAGY